VLDSTEVVAWIPKLNHLRLFHCHHPDTGYLHATVNTPEVFFRNRAVDHFGGAKLE